MLEFLVTLAVVLVAAGLYMQWKNRSHDTVRDEFLQIREMLKETARHHDQQLRENREVIRESIRDMKDDVHQAISRSVQNQAHLLRMAVEQVHQLKTDVEKQMEQIRKENNEKLEHMQKTVDEKLEITLKRRLDDSFSKVSELLTQVNVNLGQVHSLTDHVSTLNRMLNNVKQRGNFGEIQLENILEDILAPDQYIKNCEIQGRQRVEFAIKLPVTDEERSFQLLPIDAKFPEADYQKLRDAQEAGDRRRVEEAQKALARKIRDEAKNIEKYIVPPLTTEFAVMFLPTESLFAEVLRIPGLLDEIRRNKVIITGPVTLAAFLHSLRIGFKAVAIRKQTNEILNLLESIQNDFDKFGQSLEKARKKLEDAETAIDKAFTDTQKIRVSLRRVQHVSISDRSSASGT
ncbi:DNA recombination protein RmuC [Staphylospora marina]|uniref:DNA recombination protein RmuC n=1 Tax=Staphylospora marina TaxID=2490858 RepID=UPI000F5BED22|nr:DNA recombination protein RmuC [Staphylospora marina]